MGNMSTGGAWIPDEKLMHSNVLELKTSHKHIKITSDNTTAIHYINKIGTSHQMESHHQVLNIWEWAIIHKNYLSVAHIPRNLERNLDQIMSILNGCFNQML